MDPAHVAGREEGPGAAGNQGRGPPCPLTTKAAAQTNDFNTQLKNVAGKIRAKTVAWKTPEADLAPELKELDAIYAQHKGGNAEDLASVLMLKATVQLQGQAGIG